MKLSHFLSVLFVSGVFLAACQKEPTVTASPAKGDLKFLGSGECNPMIINGSYKKDTLLTADNYIDIQIEFTETGTYSIATDTINAYYFTNSGFITDRGSQTIRLQGAGRPYAVSMDTFHINFDGKSCVAGITVL